MGPQSPPVTRRQPLLGQRGSPVLEKRKVGEVAGRTAADCTAVCCCCPCTVMNLMFLAVFKVPTGLCRKAWKKKQKQRLLKKKALSQPPAKHRRASSFDESDMDRFGPIVADTSGDGLTAAVDLDSAMWDQFYGAGFWRSPSQREDNSP